MKRRDFVNYVGIGCVAGTVPAAIAACTPASETTTDTTADATVSTPEAGSASPESSTGGAASGEGFAPLGTVADLDAAGFLAAKDLGGGPVIAIRDPANPAGVLAFNAACTHRGCPVEWAESNFACPCHGSKYSPTGEVTNGPATAPLAQYEAKIEGDSVLVKVA